MYPAGQWHVSTFVAAPRVAPLLCEAPCAPCSMRAGGGGSVGSTLAREQQPPSVHSAGLHATAGGLLGAAALHVLPDAAE